MRTPSSLCETSLSVIIFFSSTTTISPPPHRSTPPSPTHSAFIVVDLQLVMKKLTPDEYVLGAINLYLDLINLFLHILRIMGQRR